MGKKKCCKCCQKKKSKNCCELKCIICWIVFGIGLTFLLLYILHDCQIYHEVTLDDGDVVNFWLTIVAISWVMLFTLLYTFFTKCQLACCCCCCCLEALWFILHIALFVTAALKNAFGKIYESSELVRILKESVSKSKTFPTWFLNMQKRNNCCGVENTSAEFDNDTIFPATLIQTCNSSFWNLTSGATNTTQRNSTNDTIGLGCLAHLNDTYVDCRGITIMYLLVLLCIGLVPFIIYVLSYRNKAKVDAEENAKKSPEDEEQAQNKEKELSPSKQNLQDGSTKAKEKEEADDKQKKGEEIHKKEAEMKNKHKWLTIDLQSSEDEEEEKEKEITPNDSKISTKGINGNNGSTNQQNNSNSPSSSTNLNNNPTPHDNSSSNNSPNNNASNNLSSKNDSVV